MSPRLEWSTFTMTAAKGRLSESFAFHPRYFGGWADQRYEGTVERSLVSREAPPLCMVASTTHYLWLLVTREILHSTSLAEFTQKDRFGARAAYVGPDGGVTVDANGCPALPPISGSMSGR